jgi:CheY-like chemotaxis protein
MDDDDLVRSMMTRSLEVAGYEVEATAEGRAAVSAYRAAMEEQGTLMDPRFLLPNGFQGGTSMRFGVRFIF